MTPSKHPNSNGKVLGATSKTWLRYISDSLDWAGRGLSVLIVANGKGSMYNLPKEKSCRTLLVAASAPFKCWHSNEKEQGATCRTSKVPGLLFENLLASQHLHYIANMTDASPTTDNLVRKFELDKGVVEVHFEGPLLNEVRSDLDEVMERELLRVISKYCHTHLKQNSCR